MAMLDIAEPLLIRSWPSKLDNVSWHLHVRNLVLTALSLKSVAGGIPSGMVPFECLVKECHEEASLPEQLVRQRARYVTPVSNMRQVLIVSAAPSDLQV